VARQWLVKFAEVCQKDITSALANIWDEQLRDIEPDLLARACDKLMKKWNIGFLPVPGNVRDEANGIVAAECMKANMALAFEEEQKRKEEAKRRYERAIALAEQKRQLPAPGREPPPVTPPRSKPRFCPVPSILSIEEQKNVLRKRGLLPN
jgi:hypothetical protein